MDTTTTAGVANKFVLALSQLAVHGIAKFSQGTQYGIIQ